MAATAHLTAVALDNEKFTVPIGAKQIAQAQSLLTRPRSGDGSNLRLARAKALYAGKRGRKGVSDYFIGPVAALVAVEAAVVAAA